MRLGIDSTIECAWGDGITNDLNPLARERKSTHNLNYPASLQRIPVSIREKLRYLGGLVVYRLKKLLRKWSRKRKLIQVQARPSRKRVTQNKFYAGDDDVWVGMKMEMEMKRHLCDALQCAEHVEAPDAGHDALLLGVSPCVAAPTSRASCSRRGSPRSLIRPRAKEKEQKDSPPPLAEEEKSVSVPMELGVET
ncbi:hypothetical protein BC826DRAFT_1110327 [Russula brevipes]|nr:hypothetical protein BC826DRAFT_1110327 [Russula brevipes]